MKQNIDTTCRPARTTFAVRTTKTVSICRLISGHAPRAFWFDSVAQAEDWITAHPGLVPLIPAADTDTTATFTIAKTVSI